MELELFKPDPQPEQDAGLNLRYQPAPDTIERCIKLTEQSKKLKYETISKKGPINPAD